MTPRERDKAIREKVARTGVIGPDLAAEHGVTIAYIYALCGKTETRANKYGAKKTVVDGITFASKGEADRYVALQRMEWTGAITDLTIQPSFDLHGADGSLVCRYIADFSYRVGGDLHVEDVKSDPTATPLFRLKRKLFLSEYPSIPLHIVDGKGRERRIVSGGKKRKRRPVAAVEAA